MDQPTNPTIYEGDNVMSDEYQNLENDILIDKVFQKNDELTVEYDNFTDELPASEFAKLISKSLMARQRYVQRLVNIQKEKYREVSIEAFGETK